MIIALNAFFALMSGTVFTTMLLSIRKINVPIVKGERILIISQLVIFFGALIGLLGSLLDEKVVSELSRGQLPEVIVVELAFMLAGFSMMVVGLLRWVPINVRIREPENLLKHSREQLSKQTDYAIRANVLKTEFLANMSHELRTPLNAVIGFSELMYDEKVGDINDVQREYLSDILSSSYHLLQLINDSLDLSKIESGQIKLRPEIFNLSKTIKKTVSNMSGLAAKNGITIIQDLDPNLDDVFTDHKLVKQVIINLLSNAIKFTQEGGSVTVRTKNIADRFEISFVDTGIGIKEIDLPKLFIAFQQLDSSSSKEYQGSGLGLALTKQIVATLNGEVSVISAPGRGSTFTVSLPKQVTGALDRQLSPISSTT